MIIKYILHLSPPSSSLQTPDEESLTSCITRVRRQTIKNRFNDDWCPRLHVLATPFAAGEAHLLTDDAVEGVSQRFEVFNNKDVFLATFL